MCLSLSFRIEMFVSGFQLLPLTVSVSPLTGIGNQIFNFSLWPDVFPVVCREIRCWPLLRFSAVLSIHVFLKLVSDIQCMWMKLFIWTGVISYQCWDFKLPLSWPAKGCEQRCIISVSWTKSDRLPFWSPASANWPQNQICTQRKFKSNLLRKVYILTHLQCR